MTPKSAILDKKTVLKMLKHDHAAIQKFIDPENLQWIGQDIIAGEWTFKDILIHLTAWNWECIAEIDRILHDEAVWPDYYQTQEGEDKFNAHYVSVKRGEFIRRVVIEWEQSFKALIIKIKSLKPAQWTKQSGTQVWDDKTAVTVYSLYTYEYESKSHEAGHALQIKQYLKNHRQ